MIKRAFIVLAACCLLFSSAAMTAAQDSAQKPAEPPKPVGQPVTVRIELTISDQMGTAAPVKKTVTMLAADGEMARVRSTNSAFPVTSMFRQAQFSVDAKPTLVQDKIRVDLSVFYDPEPGPAIPAAGDQKDPWHWNTMVQESMAVIVENGKPLVISQSADPRTERKVTVEVKATILK